MYAGVSPQMYEKQEIHFKTCRNINHEKVKQFSIDTHEKSHDSHDNIA